MEKVKEQANGVCSQQPFVFSSCHIRKCTKLHTINPIITYSKLHVNGRLHLNSSLVRFLSNFFSFLLILQPPCFCLAGSYPSHKLQTCLTPQVLLLFTKSMNAVESSAFTATAPFGGPRNQVSIFLFMTTALFYGKMCCLILYITSSSGFTSRLHFPLPPSFLSSFTSMAVAFVLAPVLGLIVKTIASDWRRNFRR